MMATVDIAVIKDNVIVNNIVVEEELVDTPEEMETFRIALGADILVNPGFTATIGSLYDPSTGKVGKPPKPFEDWVWGVENRWIPPVEYPSDGKLYNWNQLFSRWDLEDQEAFAEILRSRGIQVNPIL
jgi:hypothetical protein